MLGKAVVDRGNHEQPRPIRFAGVVMMACLYKEIDRNTGSLAR